jgi:hypothetical protein
MHRLLPSSLLSQRDAQEISRGDVLWTPLKHPARQQFGLRRAVGVQVRLGLQQERVKTGHCG